MVAQSGAEVRGGLRLHRARFPPAARRFAERVVAGTRQLEAFPNSGRIAPEFGREDMRELIIQRYRVVYRLAAEAVHISTIQHGARLLDASWLDDADDC